MEMQTPHVQTEGSRIVLQFETLDDALRLFSPWRGAAPRAEAATKIHSALAAVGLGVEVRVKDQSVAELGRGEMRGPILSLLTPAG
jgi:hypothetical protein